MILRDKSILKAMWAGMFLLCALMGFVPPQTGANKWLLLIFGVLFFLPPALLVYHSVRTHDEKQLRLVRNLSLISLSATLLLLVINLFSIFLSRAMGDMLHYLLTIVSTPMICCQYEIVSLFLWAVLLWSCLHFLKNPLK